MAAAPRKPTKPTPLTPSERVQKRYEADRAELAPGIINKAKFARKYGEGEYNIVTDGKRKQVVDAMNKRQKRDSELVDTYGKDAYKARSFMSEQGPSLTKKAMGGKMKMVEKGGKKVPAFAADGIGKMAKGGKVSEYGGKEMYKSKAAMMKHEGKESKSMEKKEAGMAKGGKARGMGAATKGGNFSKNG